MNELSLFKTKREFLWFLSACGIILLYSLLIEYNNYKNITRFDTALLHATVLKQYTKTKLTKHHKQRSYEVLKLKTDNGVTFYTSASKNFPPVISKNITIEINTKRLGFYKYLSGFYAYGRISHVDRTESFKEKLNTLIDSEHTNKDIGSIYKALYTATPLSWELQKKFSTLGISHLIAISGFHLGVLAALLYFLFKHPYKYLQNNYFPYRNYTLDSFYFVSVLLFGYLLFLDVPPSLLRSYAMLFIGFILYDRGYKIISMQTLFITITLLLALFPRLIFSIGFGLSIAGVFYIFLFLIHFAHLSKFKQFLLLPFWVYVMMLPLSLYLFSNFSLWHPLSIAWSILFTLFYPLSIFLHLTGHGNILDSVLNSLIHMSNLTTHISLNPFWVYAQIVLSLAAIWRKSFVWVLLGLSVFILINSIYNVAQL